MATGNLEIEIKSEGCENARAVLDCIAGLAEDIENEADVFEFDTGPCGDGSISSIGLKVRLGSRLSELRDALNRLD